MPEQTEEKRLKAAELYKTGVRLHDPDLRASALDLISQDLLRCASIGLHDCQDAPDVVQDAVIALCRQEVAATFSGNDLLPWAASFVKKRCQSWNRSRRRRLAHQEAAAADGAEPEASRPLDPLLKEEQVAQLRRGIVKVATRASELRVMALVLKGRSMEAIALRVQQPVGTVKATAHRMRNRLRRIPEFASALAYLDSSTPRVVGPVLRLRHAIAVFGVLAAGLAIASGILLSFGDPPPPVVVAGTSAVPGVRENVFPGERHVVEDATHRIQVAEADDRGVPKRVTAEVRGRVVDEANRPVATVRVEWYSYDALDLPMRWGDPIRDEPDFHMPPVVVWTDAKGRFELSAPVRAPAVMVIDRGGAFASIHYVDHMPYAAGDHHLPPIQVRLAGAITGTVLDDHGEPLAGVCVRATDSALMNVIAEGAGWIPRGSVLVSGGQALALPAGLTRLLDALPVATAITDSAGTFRVDGVPAGSNLVWFASPGRRTTTKYPVRVRAGRDRQLPSLRLGSLDASQLVVRESTDSPVVGARVCVSMRPAFGLPHVLIPAGRTDGDGVARVALATAEATIAVQRERGAPWQLFEAVESRERVVLPIKGRSDLRVRVVDDEGRAVPGAELKLRGGLGLGTAFALGMRPSLERTASFEGGEYRLSEIPHGSYSLLVRSPRHALRVAPVDVPLHEPARVVLQPVTPLVVRVVRSDTSPVSGAAVLCQSTHGAWIEGELPVDLPQAQTWRRLQLPLGQTGNDGTLRVETLPPGKHQILVVRPGLAPAFKSVFLETRANDVELDFVMREPGVIAGRVVGPFGPRSGDVVIVGSLHHQRFAGMPVQQISAVTDAQGRFLIGGLDPGTYKIGLRRSAGDCTSMGRLLDFIRKPANVEFTEVCTRTVKAGGEVSVDLVAGPLTSSGEPSVNVAVEFLMNDGPPPRGTVLQVRDPDDEARSLAKQTEHRSEFHGVLAVVGNLREMATYRIEVHRDLGTAVLAAGVVPWQSGTIVSTSLRTRSFEGIVQTDDGRPVRAPIVIRGVLSEASEWPGATALFRITPDRAGCFHIPDIAFGAYEIVTDAGELIEPDSFEVTRSVELDRVTFRTKN